MSDTKWKEWLLKSSLPLEHLVAEKLAKLGWNVWGQYSYSRLNESGVSTDFSADLHANKDYSSSTHWIANLRVLIECKYASPGVKWVFLPYPETAQLFSGMVKVFDQAANKRVTNRKPLEDIEEGLDYCIRGISLYDSGFDENAIHRGASQLRYAMPRLAEEEFFSHANDRHDEDIAIPFVCAILVTTAPIYRLKKGLAFEQIYAAKSLEEITEQCEALILWESESPDRIKYSHGIYQQFLAEAVQARLSSYASVFKPTKRCPYPPREDNVERVLAGSGDHVLVTTYEHLPKLLHGLDKAVRQSIKSVAKIANVQFDKKSRQAIISPASAQKVSGKANA